MLQRLNPAWKISSLSGSMINVLMNDSRVNGKVILICVAATGVPQVHLAARHVCGEVGARSAGFGRGESNEV